MTYAWFDVTRNAGIARIMHMSYRSKTYTWKDVILVKRIMIRVLRLCGGHLQRRTFYKTSASFSYLMPLCCSDVTCNMLDSGGNVTGTT